MQIIPNLLIILCLTGCATSKEQFDCKHGIGVGCKSITAVNQMVNNGSLGNNHNSSTQLVTPYRHSKVKGEGTKVARVNDTNLRVWIAPYQDAYGYFHEGAILHTILQPGYWQVTEVN